MEQQCQQRARVVPYRLHWPDQTGHPWQNLRPLRPHPEPQHHRRPLRWGLTFTILSFPYGTGPPSVFAILNNGDEAGTLRPGRLGVDGEGEVGRGERFE
jgi:hypothetical protein